MLAISFTLALASSRRSPTSVDPRRALHLTGQSVVICGAVCAVIGTLETALFRDSVPVVPPVVYGCVQFKRFLGSCCCC